MEKPIRTTFSIPKKLKKRLDKHPEVNWPEIFKQGLEKKLEILIQLKKEGRL